MKVRPVAIVWCAVALHLTWGCLLLISGKVLGATALHAFEGLPRLLTAAIMFSVATMAAVGAVRRGPRPVTLGLLLPQQAVLSISAMSAVSAVAHSRYGDGVPRPWYFILADQTPVIMTMVLHTIAVVQLHLTDQPPTAHLRARLAAVQQEADRLRLKISGDGAGDGHGGTAFSGGGEDAGRDRTR
ncbi:MAG TPA: hypothetical protein VF069_09605 [Streptosporangiaceae bacterium]